MCGPTFDLFERFLTLYVEVPNAHPAVCAAALLNNPPQPDFFQLITGTFFKLLPTAFAFRFKPQPPSLPVQRFVLPLPLSR